MEVKLRYKKRNYHKKWRFDSDKFIRKNHFKTLGGYGFFIANDTEIKFKENKSKKGLSNIINRNLTLKGSLLAKISKNLARPIQIRTPNAIVSVKGTEF